MYYDSGVPVDLSGTAFAVFAQAAASGEEVLPVAFRITDSEGEATGLAAQGVPFRQPAAKRMVMSGCRRQRAAAAVLAIDFAARSIQAAEAGRIRALI